MNNDYIHYSTLSRRNQEGEWGGGAFFRQNRLREEAPSRTGSTEGFAKKYVKKPKTLLTKEQNCVIISTCLTPVWWNWQTRGTQNPVVAIPCGFDPHHRHQRIRQVDARRSEGQFCKNTVYFARDMPYSCFFRSYAVLRISSINSINPFSSGMSISPTAVK